MSSKLAKQYHSVTIGDKNTWDDWHLIPTSRPTFGPPEANMMLVEVPGANGSLNLSKAMTGYVTYKNRSGSFEFLVQTEYWGGSWTKCYHTIMSYLHGEERHAILDDEPDYYYDCIWNVGSWTNGSKWPTVVLSYSAQPFKKSLHGVSEPWLWDPFSFETGVINNFQPYDSETGVLSPITIDGSLTINIIGGDEPVAPTFDIGTITGSLTVALNNGTAYALTANKVNRLYKIKMAGPNNRLVFTGNGVLKGINYTAGWF